MEKSWQLIQALEEGKVISNKGHKEFIIREKGKIQFYLKKSISPLENVVLHPEKWEIITVQKFERIFSNC
jgi:hypothetical protein